MFVRCTENMCINKKKKFASQFINNNFCFCYHEYYTSAYTNKLYEDVEKWNKKNGNYI